MKHYLTILILLAAGTMDATAGIDFTPTEGTRMQEGIAFKQLLFHDHGYVITYQPPAGWTCNGDTGGLHLSPPNVSQAQVTVQQVPLSAPQVFDEPTTKQLQQLVASSLPSGTQNVTLVAEEQNPIRIHLQDTYGVTVAYNYLGQDYEANVLFANLGDTQLRFRTVARKADFEKVWRAFRGSLFSFSWPEAPAAQP